MKKVLVPIADGVEEIEASCIIDVLRRANADVTVASVGSMTISASRGLMITADALISDCVNTEYDLIALPGGMPGAEHLRDCTQLIEMIRNQKAAGRYYAAICASPAVVLQHHGLIDDRKATCYPSMLEKLSLPIADELVVVDKNCITSKGPGTAIAFSLKLVELLFSKETANQIAKAMLA
ncbi:MAG: DJ-1/PfpI family protein [Anaerohalosphaera sp.]|nr:DJ-1/PfpI family protein [Anaerohalosphaera sp.]